MWWKIPVGIVAILTIAFVITLSQVDITLGILKSSLFGLGTGTPDETASRQRLHVPDGFSVGLYAGDVTNARFIEFSDAGDLIVAQPRRSTVTLLERDANGDGKADGRRVLLSGLDRPHSIDFFSGYLYVAEATAVGRVPFDVETGQKTGEYQQIITGLAANGNHWTKTIRFGPDGLLYLAAGSTCNVCEEEDPMRAAITRYRPDGSGGKLFATGLRNSVGFDWAPFDNKMYATDNGRDLLGDDYPPCELNRVEQGNFYGWPYVNGFGDLDPNLGDRAKAGNAIDPVHGFRPHNAPLGIRFINIPAFPDSYADAALVALHGSWNRSTYDGYKVVSLHRDDDGGFTEKDFLSGFEKDGDILGRPVDVAAGPDDCAYISDDYGMAIYRVCFGIEQDDMAATMTSSQLETGLEDFSEARLDELRSEGRHLFRTRGCLACHVVETQKPPFGLRLLKNLDQKYTLDTLAGFYRTPTPPMPPVRLAGESEELALSTYLLTLDSDSAD